MKMTFRGMQPLQHIGILLKVMSHNESYTDMKMHDGVRKRVYKGRGNVLLVSVVTQMPKTRSESEVLFKEYVRLSHVGHSDKIHTYIDRIVF